MAAAVADWRVANESGNKIKKVAGRPARFWNSPRTRTS
jgi:phosphopantothenoylcysteine synthetase/decarboxylase